MKVSVAKIVKVMGKIVAFVLIAAGVVLLLAERMHEGPFTNFIRSLM